MPAPWTIYAKQLFHHGYGFPLWAPEPERGRGEVQIGDVAWLHDGQLCRMFNSRKGESGQPRHVVPVDYMPLKAPDLVLSAPLEKITQSSLCSRSIQRVEVAVEIETNLDVPSLPFKPAGVSFGFECTKDTGALLLLSPTGTSQDLLSHKSITTYILEHFARWTELANARLGLGLKDEELLFVSGTTKTARWAVAAFHGNYVKKRGMVKADLSSAAEMKCKVTIEDEILPDSYFRLGPKTERDRNSPSRLKRMGSRISTLMHREKSDQCIFVHYYKVKRRPIGGPQVMRAAAGPHELPRRERDDDTSALSFELGTCAKGCSEDIRGERRRGHGERYDPVSDLLEYILQHSNARVAIASDHDVYSLFKGKGFPEDVASALAQLRPPVHIDDNGVGMVIPTPPSELSSREKLAQTTPIGASPSSRPPSVQVQQSIPHHDVLKYRTRLTVLDKAAHAQFGTLQGQFSTTLSVHSSDRTLA